MSPAEGYKSVRMYLIHNKVAFMMFETAWKGPDCFLEFQVYFTGIIIKDDENHYL